jgi:molybdate transport system substrate-binding protein
MKRLVPATVLLAAVLLAAACGSDSTPPASNSGSAAPPVEQKTLTVLAAASLTESFTALEKRFETEHAGVDVKISFAGSSALAQQIIQGAKADVFASADEANMKKVTDASLTADTPQIFATNQLTIAVPPGNPKKITGLADLGKDGVIVVVCAPQVPCGTAAQKVERAAGVPVKPRSEEQDVKAVLTKVQAGEADAGLVYLTDVNSAKGKVEGVAFPEAAQAVNRYPIAVVKDAPQADLAKAFVDLVRGAGKDELTKVGFSIP